MKTALLVPAYNAVQYLPRLRAQVSALCPQFDEVIVFDDASSDGTDALARDLSFDVRRGTRNRGPGAARNALARLTDADWIHFHDVDDEIAPDYLNHFPHELMKRSDIIFHFVDFIDEITRGFIMRWQFDTNLARDSVRQLLISPMGTTSSFMRRAALLSVGGFDERHRCFEDGDLHFRIAASGARVQAVSEVLEWSLRHSRGLSADQHYCQACRLSFLRSYASTLPSNLREDLGREAEKVFSELLRAGDVKQARDACKLSKELGRTSPTTNSLFLRVIRAFASSTAMRIQNVMRHGVKRRPIPRGI